MLQRPKVGETEEDLLKQQEEFLKASGKQPINKRRKAENEEKKFEVLGDIVEKTPTFFNSEWQPKVDNENGFPKTFVIDYSLAQNKKGKKSLFAMQLEKNKGKVQEKTEEENMVTDMVTDSPVQADLSSLKYSQNDHTIHEENVEKLSKMTEEEILQEQQKLLETLDPKLVSFLKSRNKGKEDKVFIKDENKTNEIDPSELEEEVKKNLEKYMDSRWVNMDFIETEKLEWIGDIPDKKSLEPDQPFSARFDFKGELQPFTTEIDVRSSLYHHGDEPNRPGYTIQELYQLSRSQILQQRILALNTLANIIRKTKLGYYDKCFDGQLLNKLMESDLFFLLRFSVDDNPLIAASINCLHNFICNESDEFCLDKLLGMGYVDEQPLLFDKIDANKDEEKELKDHVVISCDMIKGIVRTDLLIRLAYVLNTFSLTRETVIRAVKCLIRISRHSLEAALKIFDTSNLLDIIFEKIRSPEPVYEGVKLFRVLISHSKDIAVGIMRRFDLKFLVFFIEAEENPNISKKEFYLLKLETLYFWRSLLLYDLLVSEFIMWSPCLVRLLLFYTQKVDVSEENDFDFELFSAMSSLNIVCNKHKITPDPNVLMMMKICLEKWLTQLIQLRKFNFAVSKAIGSAFRYFTSYFKSFGVNIVDLEFLKKINVILGSLFRSEVFVDMTQALLRYSHVLTVTEVKRDPENLPSLCTVYEGGEEFLKIVQNSSTLPFFISLTKYLKAVHRISGESGLVVQLFCSSTELDQYISKVSRCRLKTHNWFVKFETGFLSHLLQLMVRVKDVRALQLGFFLLPLLRVDDKNCKKVLSIICSKNTWKMNAEFIDHLDSLYSELLLRDRKEIHVLNYKNDLVSNDWMYKALTILRGKEGTVAVANILKFIATILRRTPELMEKVPHTFRYYHMCSVFLTDSNVFDTEIQNTLKETFQDVVDNRKKVNLNMKFDKNKSFYDLYTELITQYAGVSYGLSIFAQFILFPLQNTFNVSFRKLIWFEYHHVLRVVTLPFPVASFVDLEDFIKPCETDESLLVAYVNSLSNNVILKKRNPFVYHLAIGNVKRFLDSEKQDEKLLTFLKKKIEQIKHEELKNDILNFTL